MYRVHLHEALKKRATEAEGKGVPVELRTSSRVVDVDPATATVTLENGETVQGDLVIGADGVHVSLLTLFPHLTLSLHIAKVLADMLAFCSFLFSLKPAPRFPAAMSPPFRRARVLSASWSRVRQRWQTRARPSTPPGMVRCTSSTGRIGASSFTHV